MENRTELKGTILLVDDVPASITLVRSVLEDAGYTVLVVTSGEKVVFRAADLQPDLILLDILMRGIDGYEICKQLKVNQKTRPIPVIFLSALSNPFDKTRGFELGAVDYLTKPVDTYEMLARVRTHISLYRLQKKYETRTSLLQWELAESAKSEHATQEEIAFFIEKKVAEHTAKLQVANEKLARNVERGTKKEAELATACEELKSQNADLKKKIKDLQEAHDHLKRGR
jgi:DNA-binding response OmpR family regulator